MRSCDDFSDALTGFEPVNYKDIRDGTLNTDYSVVSSIIMLLSSNTECIFQGYNSYICVSDVIGQTV